MPELESIVLRTPGSEGDFKFYVAKLPKDQAERLEHELSHGGIDPQLVGTFSDALDLSQVMRQLDTRNFQVFDLTVR